MRASDAVRLIVLGGAVASVAGAFAPHALAADTVTVRALSGRTYEGSIDASGDTHAFLLADFAPQLFDVSLKPSKGSTLVPDLFLEDPGSMDQTGMMAGVRTDGPRSVVVKGSDALTMPGTWVLRVGGKMGTTGGYRLKVSARVVKAFKGTGAVPATADISFFAPTGSAVSLKVVRSAAAALVPEYGAVGSPPCTTAVAVPGTKAGTATIAVPYSGDYFVTVEGDGGTQGGFAWTAKVKALKPSKVPVRVNGGAVYFPGEGPAPAKLLASAGQSVVGFDTDGVDLCWREVRTSGNPMQSGKNSVDCLALKGLSSRKLANNFATDPTPSARAFALGPTACGVEAEGSLHLVPRGGGSESVLDSGLVSPVRVLAGPGAIYRMDAGGIQGYDFTGTPFPVASGAATYHDMAFGGAGMIYASTTGGGDLEIRTVDLAGAGDALVAGIGPDPAFSALAARGPDAYLAVSDGAGGTSIHHASACDPGTVLPLATIAMTPVVRLAADAANAYALALDPSDGARIVQIPAGGGESLVLARGNDATGYSIVADNLVAAGGWVYFLADDGGPAFHRVKPR